MGAAATTPTGKRGSRPGERRGGRAAGTPNRSTAEVKALAQAFGANAIETLAEIMKDSPNDAARIAAARELLDRAYGRPVQQIAGDPDGAPISLAVEIMQMLEGTGRGLPSDGPDGAP